MNNFSAVNFCNLMSTIDRLIGLFAKTADVTTWQLSDEEAKEAEGLIKDAETHCGDLGLAISLKQISRMRMLFVLEKHIGGHSRDLVHKDLICLKDRITDEMDSVLFFFVRPDLAKFYNDPLAQFGEDAALAFPRAKWDIEEAARCIALRRHGGAVFHSIRVAEHVLRAFAFNIGIVRDREVAWQVLIDATRGRLKADVTRPDSKKTTTRQRAFYASILEKMEDLKIATRNPAIHEVGKVVEEEAMEAFENVRALVRKMIDNGIQEDPTKLPVYLVKAAMRGLGHDRKKKG